MAIVKNSYIHLTLECSECGYQWDIKELYELNVREAEMDAENEPCPECKDE